MPTPADIEVLEISELDLRTVFPREDTAFTPWLAAPKNLARLGRALSIPLEIVATEVSTGTFRADIVARSVEDDTTVVIENQFGRSNHDHLGKVLTYLSALEAHTVVWIAESFADEHRATLSWLNDHTPEDVRFFAVVPRLVRVGDSAPGLRFDLEVKPNRFVKRVKQSNRQLDEVVGATREAFWPVFQSCLDQDLASVPVRYGGRLGFLWMLPEVASAHAAVEPHLLVYISMRSGTAGRIGLAIRGQDDEGGQSTLGPAWATAVPELRRLLPGAEIGDGGLEIDADFSTPAAMEAAAKSLLPAIKTCLGAVARTYGP